MGYLKDFCISRVRQLQAAGEQNTGGGIGTSVLDMLNLRYLLDKQAGRMNRQLQIQKPGFRERSRVDL